MNVSTPLQDRLLSIMDRKDHWAWTYFTRPGLSRAQLLAHFRHEFHTYVRDFPVLLAALMGQGPPKDVRASLAENIFEEQTGKLSLGVPHPDLFLEMMEGLGFSGDEVERREPPLEPEATTYRGLLERFAASPPWQAGAAVLTIFVEGSRHERQVLDGTREEPPIEEAVRKHPLVAHYGCPPDKMRLPRAHRLVEGGHRRDAWKMVLDHVFVDGKTDAMVIAAVEEAHRAWLAYRDGVARAMNLSRLKS
jgi:pyrroloquinoline quinone (PQQ) biosynthesis protein C